MCSRKDVAQEYSFEYVRCTNAIWHIKGGIMSLLLPFLHSDLNAWTFRGLNMERTKHNSCKFLFNVQDAVSSTVFLSQE